MLCAKCGKVLPDDAKFCTGCGASIASSEPAPAIRPGAGSSYGPKSDVPPPAPAYGTPASEGPRATPPGTSVGRLIARVKAILFRPATEWPVIAAETTTRADIYLRYVAPLVAMGALASFVGAALVGIPIPALGTVRLGAGAAFAGTVLHFVLTFVSVFVVALIVDALAPTFGGRKDALRALKVTAYSFTPAWVAAVLTVLPSLGPIAGLLGLYGLYLLYLGLPVLMRSPADRSLGYTVVIVLCAIVLSLLVAIVTGFVLTAFGPDAGVPRSGTV